MRTRLRRAEHGIGGVTIVVFDKNLVQNEISKNRSALRCEQSGLTALVANACRSRQLDYDFVLVDLAPQRFGRTLRRGWSTRSCPANSGSSEVKVWGLILLSGWPHHTLFPCLLASSLW